MKTHQELRKAIIDSLSKVKEPMTIPDIQSYIHRFEPKISKIYTMRSITRLMPIMKGVQKVEIKEYKQILYKLA